LFSASYEAFGGFAFQGAVLIVPEGETHLLLSLSKSITLCPGRQENPPAGIKGGGFRTKCLWRTPVLRRPRGVWSGSGAVLADAELFFASE